MRLFLSGLTLIVTAWLTVPAGTLAAAPNRPKDIPVSVTFVDGGTANIQSDGNGAYRDGTGGVVAYINGAFGNSLTFASNTASTGGRQLNFHFGFCLLPEGCSYPFLTGNAVAQINVYPRNASGTAVTNGLLGMAPGSTLRAATHIRVLGQPEEWTLCMKPEDGGVCGTNFPTAPAGTYIRVTRASAMSWTFFATAVADAAGRSDVADLMKTVGTGKRKTTSLEGTFSMPFQFTATCVREADCP